MLRTRLTDLFQIPVPVVLAPFGPWDQTHLAVEVCTAGALGSLGTATRSAAELVAQWQWVRERTDGPFAVNHTGRPFDADAFEATLRFAPAAISFHMGLPADLIARAHDSGIRWIQTVGDVAAAEQAVAAGADVLVAQGGEAGGNAGWISTLVLVPAVVDVAGEVPVVAAGGIADGRGIAAALTLGAAGASLGTRFLATDEMAVDPAWKRRIVAADAQEAVKVSHSERVMPPFTLPQVGAPFAPRALRTDFDRPAGERTGGGRPIRAGTDAAPRRASGWRARPAALHRPVGAARPRHRPGARPRGATGRRDRARARGSGSRAAVTGTASPCGPGERPRPHPATPDPG
jgi:enoyl-[acyl-carrier protein] reductase II